MNKDEFSKNSFVYLDPFSAIFLSKDAEGNLYCESEEFMGNLKKYAILAFLTLPFLFAIIFTLM